MGARILVIDDSHTIRKVVASILETRAYEPVTAEDGQAALELLEKGEKIDLVLLDFVMPRMNGYQFCRELRARPEQKNLPVVLMSAKGDKIRGQFVQQTGAIDAITKPFDARGLIAVVEGALKKHQEGRARPVPDAATMPDEETIVDSLRPSSVNISNDPGLRRARATLEVGAALSRLIVPELMKLPGVPDHLTGGLTEAIQRSLTTEALDDLAPSFGSFAAATAQSAVLSGDISVISIAEILQLLHLQRQTGALTITTRRAEITLYVREGNVDFARSKGLRGEFLLGRYFVEDGAVSREDLESVLSSQAPSSSQRLGDTLRQLGLANDEQLREVLVRQTSELVYEVVRWKTGRFTFAVGELCDEATEAKLGLATSALVMEGFRRVDEWRLIEGTFDFDEVLFRDQVAIDRVAEDSKLTRQEQAVLDAIDGQRTVREIVDEMEGSSFELCKILYQFLNSRLVRRKAA
jgi:CheY-like chemotaxis protein